MTKKIKPILLFFLCLALSIEALFFAGAVKVKDYTDSKILCISHRGDTAEYEGNSLQAVMSAFEKGADFVSVNIRSDGKELVLCDEDSENVKGIALKEILGLLESGSVLILDFDSGLKGEVYKLIESEDAFASVIFRINDSADNIISWLEDKDERTQVVGVYDGFVVFSAVSHVKKLSQNDMSLVQYQSKNYFNEMFGSLVAEQLFSPDSARAVAVACNPDLCGQRTDSEDGWNDLIKRGFSVIETNNLNAFINYVKGNDLARFELTELYEKAATVDTEKYNAVSKENLSDALETAQTLLSKAFASSDEMQSACSELIFAMENMALKTDEDTQKGALSITAGKIIATVIAGGIIFSAQIYTYKMQKGKKR